MNGAVFGRLGQFGKTMGTAMEMGRWAARRGMSRIIGGAGGGIHEVAGTFRPPTQARNFLGTAIKRAKVALSGRPNTMLHGIQVGGKQIGLSGSQFGALKTGAKVTGGVGAIYGLGKMRGRRQQKKYMMRGIS